jgi:hypothetical protein
LESARLVGLIFNNGFDFRLLMERLDHQTTRRHRCLSLQPSVRVLGHATVPGVQTSV